MNVLHFPQNKEKIASLSLDEKMEWYAYLIQSAAQAGSIPMELTTPEFKRFCKWKVLIPLKIKRFFYRVKNGEAFRKYPNIIEIKKNLKENAHLI